MADNKVKVRIYGQDYTITGEREESQITEIAEYVDSKMREIAAMFSQSNIPGSLAVLASINIADEFFQRKNDIDMLSIKCKEQEEEIAHYQKMWEEVKRSFQEYKDSVNKDAGEMDSMREEAVELQKKYKEFESMYFDVQMENIQLKDQLEKLKNSR